ncbi:hypothetical protein MMPV_000076 [Pyropia vietnamensis]
MALSAVTVQSAAGRTTTEVQPPPPTTSPPPPPVNIMVADVVAGLTASAAAIAVTYPLDTLRTRSQAALLSSTVPTNALGAGWTAAAAGALATSTTKVLVRTVTGGASPAVANLVASAVGVPFDVAKTRAQAGVGAMRPAPAAGAAPPGMAARAAAALPGWTATLARDVPFAVVEVLGLLALRAAMVRHATAQREAAVAAAAAAAAGAPGGGGLPSPTAGGLLGPPRVGGWGMVAGGVGVTAVAAAVTTPLDVIKTQLMAAKRPGGTWRSVGKRTVDVARKKAGLRVLFKGVGPRTAAAAVAPLVFLGVFGAVRRVLAGAAVSGGGGDGRRPPAPAGAWAALHARAGGGG